MADTKKKGGKTPTVEPPPKARPAAPAAAGRSARSPRPAPMSERVRPGSTRNREELTSPSTDPTRAAQEAARKRRHVRVAERPALSLKVRYHAVPTIAGAPHELDGALARTDVAEDLSTGGVFVLSEAPPAVGTRLAVELDLASTWQPLIIVGEVRWHRDEPRGFGVAFVELTSAAHVALGQLLTTLKFGE